MQKKLEVMRIVRVPPLSKLVVEIRESSYNNLQEIPDAAVQRRILAAIGDLIVFAGGYQQLVDAGVAPPINTTPTNQAKPPETGELREKQAQFLAQLTQATEEELEISPTSVSLLGNLRRKRSTPPRPLSLAEQIDEILQEKIARYPQLAGRKINIVADPKGGLRILVDGRYYSRPSEIEEKGIAGLIKLAIKEWEAKT
ncbi:MAG: hypothetical protein Kow0080_04760 [Candidatus Promineifilaceae bacterium]